MRIYVYSLGFALALLLNQRAAVAQQGPNQSDLTIDAATRTAVIEGALKNLNSYYVFPETAKKDGAGRSRAHRSEGIRSDHKRKGASLGASGPSAGSQSRQTSSDDVQRRAVASGAHESDDHEPGPEELARQLEFMRTVNFGFEKVERLPGNIGYIDLRGFQAAQYGAETV